MRAHILTCTSTPDHRIDLSWALDRIHRQLSTEPSVLCTQAFILCLQLKLAIPFPHKSHRSSFSTLKASQLHASWRGSRHISKSLSFLAACSSSAMSAARKRADHIYGDRSGLSLSLSDNVLQSSLCTLRRPNLRSCHPTADRTMLYGSSGLRRTLDVGNAAPARLLSSGEIGPHSKLARAARAPGGSIVSLFSPLLEPPR